MYFILSRSNREKETGTQDFNFIKKPLSGLEPINEGISNFVEDLTRISAISKIISTVK
ncbi:hypothetical protein [Chryseobacterium indoltheticum]|uniref:hypothetical protein n=1 Tax=Chryseobacterium indoltheticum TaxID=254 RepID=UPI001913CDE5|nr:hypothetical protein [Chryseobacterium indoltheticum]QQQ29125.1 hypothetical protein JJL46_03700 [Chryseobacterium indoltheticum]